MRDRRPKSYYGFLYYFITISFLYLVCSGHSFPIPILTSLPFLSSPSFSRAPLQHSRLFALFCHPGNGGISRKSNIKQPYVK